MTTTDSTIFNPTHLVLELDRSTVERAWSTRGSANAFSQWQSYLNQVVSNAFLPWLQEELSGESPPNVQKDLWELVNGTVITIEDAKLLLVPSEAEDLSELRVPQEWIDIPTYTADYCLAVQVNIDAGYIRIWGYTTHQQLKNNGSFDRSDRTYSLSDDEIITDINALWVARELCPDEVTQAAVEPVTELNRDRVESLIERLGSQAQLLPRLAVPFTTWAGLIQNPTWCRRLIAARRGTPIKTPVLQWLQQGLTDLTAVGWRAIEMSPSASGARGVSTEATTVGGGGLAKKLAIAEQPYELRILPLELEGWRFELCCLTPGCMIREGFKLRLLTEDLEDFEGNEDIATEPVEKLCLEVDLEPGEALVWQIEPTPDNYQSEVLQF